MTPSIPAPGPSRYEYLVSKVNDSAALRVSVGCFSMLVTDYALEDGWLNLGWGQEGASNSERLSFQARQFEDAAPVEDVITTGDNRWRVFMPDGEAIELAFLKAGQF